MPAIAWRHADKLLLVRRVAIVSNTYKNLLNNADIYKIFHMSGGFLLIRYKQKSFYKSIAKAFV